jgi:hypothetical protein
MPNKKASLNRLVLVSVALAVFGCGGGISDAGSPQDRGTLLLSNVANFPTDPLWTKDGTEIVVIDHGLKAVNVSSHTVRTLNGTGSIYALGRGTGGEWIYFASPYAGGAGGPNTQVSRVNPTTAVLETVALVSSFGGFRLQVSADERWVACDDVLIDTESNTTRGLPVGGNPLGFSPDGSRLLYNNPGSSSFIVISTADGSTQPVLYNGFLTAFRWLDNSPQLLIVDSPNSGTGTPASVYEVDGFTGARKDLGQFDLKPSSFSASYSGWTEDGRTLGVWLSPGFPRNELHLIRLDGAPSVPVLVDDEVGKAIFSPNGTAIVYTVFRSTGAFTSATDLYVKTAL